MRLREASRLAPGRPCGNQLLDALPPGEFERLQAHLERRSLGVAELLHDQNLVIEFVTFPTTALISSTTLLREGASVEAVTVGSEGMAGLPVFFGSSRAAMQEMGQVPGEILRLRALVLAEALPSAPVLRSLLGSYADAVMKLLAQTVACNRMHHTTERAARWLLITRDQLGRDRLELTHEVLAMMLGARRPSVTLALQELRAAGAIQYRRNAIEVADGPLLEKLSCECYYEIRDRFEGYRERLREARRTIA
ncbi:MAG: Crp/Fnr family transcriptional regulator [Hyphomicrobiales bacterium]